MNSSSGNLVLWILIPLFAMVGLYLIWYTRSRKQMLATFANAHSFPMREDFAAELEKTLDETFSLKDINLVRSFGQLSSLVEASQVRIFRAVELLDLNPHAQAYSTNFSRILALFDVSAGYDEFFILDKTGQASPRLAGAQPIDPKVLEITRQSVIDGSARHTLSVTLKGGRGLIYFEPLVTGGETLGDVESLYNISTTMLQKLSVKV